MSAPDTTENGVLYQPITLSPVDAIPRGRKAVKKKRELFPGLIASVSRFICTLTVPRIHILVRNINRFPFDRRGHEEDVHFKTELPYLLGPTNPCPTLFTWNPSPLQSSKFSFEYLLLPPRSALEAVSLEITLKASSQTPTPAYSSRLHIINHLMAEYK